MATEQEKTNELLLDFISYLLMEDTICEDDARIFQLQAENYSKGVIEN